MKKINMLLCFASTLIVGCQTISSQDILDKQSNALNDINSNKVISNQNINEGNKLVVDVNSPYVAGRTIPLIKSANLPIAFYKASAFKFDKNGGLYTITEIADLINKNFKIRARVKADVISNNSFNSAVITDGGGGVINPNGISSFANQSGGLYHFDIKTNLSDYLDNMTNKLGINWEWFDENGGELVFYKMIRKTFIVNTSPIVNTFSSSINKGVNLATGAGNLSSGSLSGDSKSTVTLNSDAWTSIVNTINRMRSPNGYVEPNPATRTITVMDTKDVVADMGKFLDFQNDLLNRQVMLSIRLVTLEYSKKNNFDFDINAVLNKITDGAISQTLRFANATDLSATTAGSLVYEDVRTNHKYSGSTAVVKYLREIGNVINEYNQDIPVKNNRQVPLSDFKTFGYLAETTPASGSTDSAGIPGLTPGSVTSGITIVVTPTILNGEKISLLLSLDTTSDPTFTTISTGADATEQRIQLPQQSGMKVDTEITLTNNRTMLLVSKNKDVGDTTDRNGVLSYGNSTNNTKQIQILMITPRIMGEQ